MGSMLNCWGSLFSAARSSDESWKKEKGKEKGRERKEEVRSFFRVFFFRCCWRRGSRAIREL